MTSVLFVDVENGSRSQMAEAFLNKIGGENFGVFSAGQRAGYINEYAVGAMKEAGIDISGFNTKDVMKFVKMNSSFQYIIILCGERELDQCALFPTSMARLYWHFPDPLKFEGTEEEIIIQFRQLRDLIKKVVKKFVKEIEHGHSHIDADLNFEFAVR